MIEVRTTKDAARFCTIITTFSIAASAGSTMVLGQALQLPISNVGYIVSFAIPLLVAGPVSYFVGAALLRMTVLKEQLEQIATTDPLTNVLNRKGLFDRFAQLAKLPDRGPPISLIVLDVDLFKVVNDTHGHTAGDKTLAQVARILAENIRGQCDFIGRLGGEEFLIAMRGTAAEAAAHAERLRHLVVSTPVHIGTCSISVSASFGIAEWRESEPVDGALQRADRAMYAAKSLGRNRTMICSQNKSISRTKPSASASRQDDGPPPSETASVAGYAPAA